MTQCKSKPTVWTGVVVPDDQASGAATSGNRALVAVGGRDSEAERFTPRLVHRTTIVWYCRQTGGREGGVWRGVNSRGREGGRKGCGVG